VETLGDYLKNKREAQNITLEEASQVTRIRKSILKAVENNQFDLIPPKVFAQGFIKSYAIYLGLDGSEAVKRYFEALDSLEPKQSPEEEVIQKNQSQPILTPGRILLVIIVLIAVFNLWLLMRSPETENDTSLKNIPEKQPFSPVPSPSVAQQAKSGEESESLVISKGEEGPLVTEEKSTPGEKEDIVVPADEAITIPEKQSPEPRARETAVSPSEEMVLRIEAAEQAWMRIQLDQNEPFEALLKAGESYTVKAQNKFTLKIGNAGGVELFFNGKPLGNPGKPGEVVDLTLPE
jgi:cytoskeleton protein RodZ